MTDPRPGQGRSESLRARPAAQTPIEYGSDLIKSRSRGWPRYALVTSPSAEAAIAGAA